MIVLCNLVCYIIEHAHQPRSFNRDPEFPRKKARSWLREQDKFPWLISESHLPADVPAEQTPQSPPHTSQSLELMEVSSLQFGSASTKESRLPSSQPHHSSRLDPEDIRLEDPVPSGSMIDRRKLLSESNVEDSDSEEEYERIHLGFTIKDEFRVSPFLHS